MSGALHPLTRVALARLSNLDYKDFDAAIRDYITSEEYAEILEVAGSPKEVVTELLRRHPQMEEGVKEHEDDEEPVPEVDGKTAAAGPDK